MPLLRRNDTGVSSDTRWYRNATGRYVGGVLLLLAGGLAAEVFGHLLLDETSFWYALTTGIGEAFLISAILATLVDPFLKRRMQTESAWSGIFSFLNSQAPEGLREAIRDLAECKVYYSRTTWTLAFEWFDKAEGILAVTIDIRSTGRNISKEPYKLNRKAWLLASTTGYQSKYLRYAVSCPGKITSIDATTDELKDHITIQDDGSLTVDEASLSAGQAIPPGSTFEMIKRACMYRHQNGYIPLHHGKFGENVEIKLTGSAIADIDIRVAHPMFDGHSILTERRRPAASEPAADSAKFLRVTPGQTTIVSWKPATHEDVPPPSRIDLPAVTTEVPRQRAREAQDAAEPDA